MVERVLWVPEDEVHCLLDGHGVVVGKKLVLDSDLVVVFPMVGRVRVRWWWEKRLE